MGIKGVHAMFNTPQAEELRAFIRDKLQLPHHDVGEGWLIFDLAEGELGCHPDESVSHEISFYCEDIDSTVEELRGRGVDLEGEIRDLGFGRAVSMRMPGGVEVLLYEPHYSKG